VEELDTQDYWEEIINIYIQTLVKTDEIRPKNGARGSKELLSLCGSLIILIYVLYKYVIVCFMYSIINET